MPRNSTATDPNSIEQKASYKSRQARIVAVLDALTKGPVTDKSGRATEKLFRMLPVSVVRGKGDKLLSLTAFTTLLSQMEQWGWVKREVSVSGRKTYAISIGNVTPVDWRAPSSPPVVATNGEVGVQVEQPIVSMQTDTPEEMSFGEEARAGGIRPGRLAARLERIEGNIPALVEEGVVAGMKGWFTTLAVAMGLQPKQESEEVDLLVRRLTESQAVIVKLDVDLRAERQSNIAAREQLNKELRKQYSTRDTSPLQASQVEESWRGLARHALSQGWTIGRTNGGHLRWKSPTGDPYFTPSTPSDHRAVKNARSDMERMGLPKE